MHVSAVPIDPAALVEGARRSALRGMLLHEVTLALDLSQGVLTDDERAGATLIADLDAAGLVVHAVAGAVRVSVRLDGGSALASPGGAAGARIEALATAQLSVARAAPAGRGVPQRAVVLPPPEGAVMLEAYALREAPRAGDLVLGVHWYLQLSADGRRILAREPLSRAAITVPALDGRLPGTISIVHGGAHPDEIHHWLSLSRGVRLEVLALASATRWRVEGDASVLDGAL
jgi:hypothetical protein